MGIVVHRSMITSWGGSSRTLGRGGDNMQVDVTAMLQGLHDALESGEISEEFHAAMMREIAKVSRRGKVGRSECDYAQFLRAVAHVINFDPGEYAKAWRHLGHSLAEGLIVLN